MIKTIPLERILFIDIETVPGFGAWEDIPENEQILWDKKTRVQRKDEISAEEFYSERAGIMAEFGKIICITIGMLEKNETLKIKSFSGHDEKKMLQEFGEIFNSPRLHNVILCAHNGKEFDYPYLCRRILIHSLDIPKALNLTGKKPWQVEHLDTLDLWKFGDRKNYTSLDLLTAVFDIPSSKNDLDGSRVNEAYYLENGLDRIARYCQEDVLATAQLYLKLHNKPLITDEKIMKT